MWNLHKVVNRISKCIAKGEEVTKYNDYKTTGQLHGNGKLTITVDGNKITWTIDGKMYNNRNYKITDTYIDNDSFNNSAKDTKIAIMTRGTKTTYNVFLRFFNKRRG